MPDKNMLRKQANELADEVSAKMADLKAGNITHAAFKSFMDRAESRNTEIETGIKNYERALLFRQHPGDAIGPVDTLDNGQRLSFKGMAAGLVDKMVGDGMGAKALGPSGAAVIEQEFKPNPIALGQVATGLLDVLPFIPHNTAEYSYLRQTTRTNNAAVVADGDTKPTSVYSVTRIEKSLAVVAHLSEGVPRYWLEDNSSLRGFIDNELAYGLNLAVEAKVMADINATSGIQTQAYSTSVLQTLRKSLTKLELSGLVAGSIVLHPSDWEGVELALSSTNAVEHLSLPYDPATRRLFGVPVVTTVSQAAGVSHVLATDAVAVDTDKGVMVQWSETSNATDFATNTIRARCEGRFGTSVFRPLGVVVGDLTA